mgnify:CR=1 FL=1
MNMKKFLCLLLTLAMVLTLAACGGDKTPSKGDDSALSGTVVIYSTQTDVDHEVFLKIFNEAYPNVKVEFISGSLGELTARVDAEKENPQADVIFGGLSQTDGDQYLDLLQKYTPKYADQCAVESNGYYTYFAYQYVCLIKNTEVLKELGVDVNGYADLLQPELKGHIIQADPTIAEAKAQTVLPSLGHTISTFSAPFISREMAPLS